MKLDIERQIQHASRVVESWPAWKRGILNHSLRPTNSAARVPVDNCKAHSYPTSLKADRERTIRNMFSTIFALGFVFALGCFFGMLIQDRQLWRMNRAQQERGDYWFDRYMMEVRPDWKPYSEDLRDER